MEKIGLLAGAGRLPVECAKAARRLGYEVYAVALLDQTDEELDTAATDCAHISIAKLGKILSYLKSKQVKQVTMLGKVTKELLFTKRLVPDLKMIMLLASLPDKKDDTVMMGFVHTLEKAGFTAFDQTALIRELMPKAGVLTKRKPTEEERRDMEFGFKVAKELGRMDIGQTVVVKDTAVMALEAIEGTDACIKRGGALARGGAVVVKVEKPAQDSRFDVPAIGTTTIESMIEAGAAAIAIEAEKTLLVEQAKVVELADAHGIAIAVI